jgi:hypothetical protein
MSEPPAAKRSKKKSILWGAISPLGKDEVLRVLTELLDVETRRAFVNETRKFEVQVAIGVYDDEDPEDDAKSVYTRRHNVYKPTWSMRKGRLSLLCELWGDAKALGNKSPAEAFAIFLRHVFYDISRSVAVTVWKSIAPSEMKLPWRALRFPRLPAVYKTVHSATFDDHGCHQGVPYYWLRHNGSSANFAEAAPVKHYTSETQRPYSLWVSSSKHPRIFAKSLAEFSVETSGGLGLRFEPVMSRDRKRVVVRVGDTRAEIWDSSRADTDHVYDYMQQLRLPALHPPDISKSHAMSYYADVGACGAFYEHHKSSSSSSSSYYYHYVSFGYREEKEEECIILQVMDLSDVGRLGYDSCNPLSFANQLIPRSDIAIFKRNFMTDTYFRLSKDARRLYFARISAPREYPGEATIAVCYVPIDVCVKATYSGERDDLSLSIGEVHVLHTEVCSRWSLFWFTVSDCGTVLFVVTDSTTSSSGFAIKVVSMLNRSSYRLLWEQEAPLVAGLGMASTHAMAIHPSNHFLAVAYDNAYAIIDLHTSRFLHVRRTLHKYSRVRWSDNGYELYIERRGDPTGYDVVEFYYETAERFASAMHERIGAESPVNILDSATLQYIVGLAFEN